MIAVSAVQDETLITTTMSYLDNVFHSFHYRCSCLSNMLKIIIALVLHRLSKNRLEPEPAWDEQNGTVRVQEPGMFGTQGILCQR